MIHLFPQLKLYNSMTKCFRCKELINKKDIFYHGSDKIANYSHQYCEKCTGFIMSRYSTIIVRYPTFEVLSWKRRFDEEIMIKL